MLKNALNIKALVRLAETLFQTKSLKMESHKNIILKRMTPTKPRSSSPKVIKKVAKV